MSDATKTSRTAKSNEGTGEIGWRLDLALRMADAADSIALAGFFSDTVVEHKKDGTPVTRVDREIESVLRDVIEHNDPEAGILGEEYGGRLGRGRWVIDPIDGTERFIDGDSRFATLIAYETLHTPRVGVVSAPALGRRWWAGEGLGAFVSVDGVESAADVSDTSRISEAVGMLNSGYFDTLPGDERGPGGLDDRLARVGFRPLKRPVSWEAVKVATGGFDAAFAAGYWWDVAPLPVIVTEAGGTARMAGSVRSLVSVTLTNGHIDGQVPRHPNPVGHSRSQLSVHPSTD